MNVPSRQYTYTAHGPETLTLDTNCKNQCRPSDQVFVTETRTFFILDVPVLIFFQFKVPVSVLILVKINFTFCAYQHVPTTIFCFPLY